MLDLTHSARVSTLTLALICFLGFTRGEPQRLTWHTGKVVALPHIGSATTHTRRAMAELAVRNALAVLAGREPLTPVKG